MHRCFVCNDVAHGIGVHSSGLSEAILSNLKPINYFVIMSLFICVENANDNWLEDYIKSEAGAQKPTFLIQKCL